jgi:recombination protein RecR
VVESPRDVFAFESGAIWGGEYHVLGGLISPLDGVGPEDLHIRELLERVELRPPREVVLALNPSTEGESTSVYLGQILSEKGLSVSRIAYGLPVGGELEYTDPVTLARALEGRKSM